MREIKFRAKYIIDGYPFAYGNAVIQLDGRAYIFEENDPEAEVRDTGDPESHYWLVGGLYEVNPSTIGQYTGLKDKHGKEIYEGDIITSVFEEDGKESFIFDFEVIFQEGAFLALIDYDLTTHSLTELNELEVIGNIHEKPELIKQ